MSRKPIGELRRGWTTGACATAALKAALAALWLNERPETVEIELPRGETPVFVVNDLNVGQNWAQASIVKDAGDDPDVTHGALIEAHVAAGHAGEGVTFHAGSGVGIVTKPGLPVDVGEPAINPVPRQMMISVVEKMAGLAGAACDLRVTISVPGGQELAQKTWNPRLGIEGGISILGTTGIVRPFSCAAWIASIHRGIDVARADGLQHVAGCTGATSETVVQAQMNLPDHAMLDMGDFAGGLLKYLAKHPVERITIGGGFAKMTKLAQGAMDLHSGRSQVDFDLMAQWADRAELTKANTALEALQLVPALGQVVAQKAQIAAAAVVPKTSVDVIVIDRAGKIVGRAE